MKRRQFLKSLIASPIFAVPSIAISAVALSQSDSAYRRIDQAIKGDNVQITNSTFKLNGNMQVYGDQAMIHSCNFQIMEHNKAAIEFRNTNGASFKS